MARKARRGERKRARARREIALGGIAKRAAEQVARREEEIREELVSLKGYLRRERRTVLALLGIFLLAFFLRTYVYYTLSFESWPPVTAGNDPYYHKRVIDYIQTYHTHIRHDSMLNYPVVGGNPRPPIFDWSIALLGMLLGPMFGGARAVTWIIFEFYPAFWGALTVIPVYLLTKQAFDKKSGLLASLFIALTPAHIERSPLGFSDHDSFVVFFVVLSLYFLTRSFSHLPEKKWVADYRKPSEVILGLKRFFEENKLVTGYALLAGLSISAITLTWEGFPYIMVILVVYYFIQLLIDRFRNTDSLGLFIVMTIVLGLPMFLSLPYYYLFSITTWMVAFFLLLAVLFLGLIIVPTRDYPWLLVLPTLGVIIAVVYLILAKGFPEMAQLIFTGRGYFVKSKLYSTIAEAQPPDISRVIFSFGVAGFFLALTGILLSIMQIPKNLKRDYLLIVVWTTVAIYMALSAVRFVFNATPAFAVLAGWVTWRIVEKFDAKMQSLSLSLLGAGTFLVNLGIISYASDKGLTDEFYVKYFPYIVFAIALAIGYGYYLHMKYRVKNPRFKLRKVTVGVLVGFFIMYPYVVVASDAAVPYEKKRDIDPTGEYMGAFGHSLPGEYWIASFDWLSKQDADLPPEERPAFISWWDYGFWCVYMGQHPTAADNFQYGYQFAGSFIASTDEDEAIALMIARILEGDFIGNQGEFSKEVADIMKDYLNYTTDPSDYMRLVDIYSHPDKYVDEVEARPEVYGHYVDITPMNAKYAAAKVLILSGGEERMVELYGRLREVTGKSLRYFAVDSRLFPFSASNTGIFYAPIKLADRDLNDYLEYYAYAQKNYGTDQNPDWRDLPDNPISMDELEKRAKDEPHKYRVKRYELHYTENFYKSMFYKAYIGYGPEDIGMSMDGVSVPAMKGSLQNYPPMQGWNMSHFRLVYRTMYWSPKDEKNSTTEDYIPMSYKEAVEKYEKEGGDIKSGLGQGVYYLKYYDGAVISGRVLTKSGVPVPGVRITILDEYGIPHGSVITDEEGRYSLLAPFGECTLLATMGELETAWDRLYQYKAKPDSREPENLLNLTRITITDEQAMRVKDWQIRRNLEVDDLTAEGRIYFDNDDSGSYDDKKDTPLEGVKVTYTMLGGDYQAVNYTNFQGYYSFYSMPPGHYRVEMEYMGFKKVLSEDLEISPSSEKKQDGALKPAQIHGYVRLHGGGQAVGAEVRLTEAEGGRDYSAVTDENGYYSIENMLPGEYKVTIDREGFMINESSVGLQEGSNVSHNLTLLPVSTCTVRVTVPGELAGGEEFSPSMALVRFVMRDTPEWRYSFFTGENGMVEATLPKGIYAVHVEYTSGERTFAAIGEVDTRMGGTFFLNITLDEAFTVYGNVTKLENMAMKYQWIRFTPQNSTGVTYAFTGPNGLFQIALPKDTYAVYIEEEIPGSINTHQFFGWLYSPPGEYVEVHYHALKSAKVSGRAFWDLNDDGIYTDAQNRTLREFLTNPAGNVTDLAMEGVRVTVSSENGTITTYTDANGEYEVNLMPGIYRLEASFGGMVSEPAYISVEDEPITMNEGLKDINLRLSSEPREVSLRVFYTRDGERVPASGLPVKVESLLDYITLNETFVAGLEGELTVSLTPGYYRLTVHTEYPGEPRVLYNGSSSIVVPPGEGIYPIEFEIEKWVEQELTVRYDGVDLNSVTLRFISVSREYSFVTDQEGRARVYLPEGNYTVALSHLFGVHHLLYIQQHSLIEGIWDLPESVEPVEGYEFSGRVVVESVYLKDYALSLKLPYYSESVPLDSTGAFTAYLLPGKVYNVSFDLKAGVNVEILYVYSDTIEADGDMTGVEIRPREYVKVEGTVFYDENDDHFIDKEERKGGANITFTDEVFGDVYTVQADEEGDYSIYLPRSLFSIEVELEGFQREPKDYARKINTTVEVKKDIPVLPSPLEVTGLAFYDENGNGFRDTGEILLPGAEVRFIAISFTGEDATVEVSYDGTYTAYLMPGTYTVYALYERAGQLRYSCIRNVTTEIGSPPVQLNLTMKDAREFTGTVFYYDTLGKLVDNLTSEPGDEILFSPEGEAGYLRVNYNRGVFRAKLPVGNYSVKIVTVREELGISMTYRYEGKITLRLNTTADELAFRLEKVKEYIIKMDTVGDEYKDIFMKPYQTLTIPLYIENRGNLPFKVTFSSSDVPEGWKVEYSVTEMHLEIGEKKYLHANITAPAKPLALNNMKLEARSEGGYRSNVQLLVRTPQYHSFEIITDAPTYKGVAFEQRLTYNLTVKNTGNGDEIVHLRVIPPPEEIEGWEVLIEGDKLSAEGKNLSLGGFGERQLHIEITVPNSTQASYGDSLHLLITGVDRLGLKNKSVEMTFEIRRPDLKVLDVKFTNLDLKNKVLNRTVVANVTVASFDREVAGVRVVLKVDGKEVGNETVDYIPQDGAEHVEFEFNVTVEGIEEDSKHTFEVVVDPQNEIEEENEADNLYRVKKLVGEEPPSLLNPRVIAFVISIVVMTVILIVWYRRKHPF